MAVARWQSPDVRCQMSDASRLMAVVRYCVLRAISRTTQHALRNTHYALRFTLVGLYVSDYGALPPGDCGIRLFMSRMKGLLEGNIITWTLGANFSM